MMFFINTVRNCRNNVYDYSLVIALNLSNIRTHVLFMTLNFYIDQNERFCHLHNLFDFSFFPLLLLLLLSVQQATVACLSIS
jgi:hypothetical protein